MAQPAYGAREGLADRLAQWAEQLSRNKQYPWIGTGIIADLKTAAAALDGRPVKVSEPEPEAWEIAAQKEYDL